MDIKNAQQGVREFQKAFNLPNEEKPKMLTPERLAFRHTLLQEEVDETKNAKTLKDLADGITDTIYIALGTAVEAGIEIEPIFQIVQNANMSKLVDGKPLYHPNGKVAKPEGWEAPEPKIQAEIDRQIHNATAQGN